MTGAKARGSHSVAARRRGPLTLLREGHKNGLVAIRNGGGIAKIHEQQRPATCQALSMLRRMRSQYLGQGQDIGES